VTLPNLKWENKSKNIVSLYSAPKSQYSIIHFWAAWCSPCIKELPEFGTWQKANSDVKAIALSMDDSQQQANTMIEISKAGIDVNLLQKQSLENYSVSGLPMTLVINKSGQILKRIDGPAKWESQSFTSELKCLLSLTE